MRIWIIFFSFLLVSTANSQVDYSNLELIKPGGETVVIKRSDLERLESYSVESETNYMGGGVYTGVSFKKLIKEYNIKGENLRAFAWDDYSYSISLSELERCSVMIAYKINGEYMTVENFGPFAIVYPGGGCNGVNKLEINARTVVQLKKMEIE
ncbi:molybdopterin-dependent oxidoreductase (plasmid) [Enterobacter sp. JBIWA003]|uniref:molybdopterin-dependent oxidoreductase n=1 Tax=Enterobacter sp. JBIWA003 TaxID=2831890 RepID=UPI001CBAE3C8|nr:molybdopterin-dependent oxidoreductase [Enterobacter sp. JBIWA003]UAN24941.1 molybdopterin-dependent oxidoreductase [Enterobacter sp. JBIWA003]